MIPALASAVDVVHTLGGREGDMKINPARWQEEAGPSQGSFRNEG